MKRRVHWIAMVMMSLVLIAAQNTTSGSRAMAEDDGHLTDHEAAQLSLDPAVNAVYEYTDQSEAAKANLTDVGIDVDEMVVVVQWVGGILDPATDHAFAKITASTGTPIKIVPTRFSREEFFAAMDDIAATQTGVKAMSSQDGEIIVKVDPDASLEGRSSAVNSAGERATGIPVRYEHSDVSPLATRQNDANPWTGGARVVNDSIGCSSAKGHGRTAEILRRVSCGPLLARR